MEEVSTHAIERADIIVGIPSYNEADNISFVVEKCHAGLQKYFPDLKGTIINVDNHSPDGTGRAFLNSVNTIPKIYISTPEGVKGKGNNFYNLFRKSAQLQAKAVVVVDADLRSITPEWIRDLGSPILKEGFDFITPLYSRNEYDGTITNNICYPLIYGLLGKDIRQPIGGDFALSGKLGNHYLSQNWQETTRQYGVDIFMTLHAITGGFQIGQVGLGAKIHKPSAPKLGPMFTQVVGTLFNTLLDNKWQWNSRLSIRKLPLFGRNILDDPQNLSVDYKNTKSTAIKEFTLHRKTLQSSLTPEIFSKVSVMFDSGKINIGTDMWAKIVYDLLYSYEQSGRNPELIEAMKALYFGRVVSFIKRTLELNHVQSEEMIRRQARYFFRMRGYLLQKYVAAIPASV